MLTFCEQVKNVKKMLPKVPFRIGIDTKGGKTKLNDRRSVSLSGKQAMTVNDASVPRIRNRVSVRQETASGKTAASSEVSPHNLQGREGAGWQASRSFYNIKRQTRSGRTFFSHTSEPSCSPCSGKASSTKCSTRTAYRN